MRWRKPLAHPFSLTNSLENMDSTLYRTLDNYADILNTWQNEAEPNIAKRHNIFASPYDAGQCWIMVVMFDLHPGVIGRETYASFYTRHIGSDASLNAIEIAQFKRFLENFTQMTCIKWQ